jgi:hypothetical protein
MVMSEFSALAVLFAAIAFPLVVRVWWRRRWAGRAFPGGRLE